MADLTKTISNSLRLFTSDSTNKWGSFLWGTGLWGASGDVVVRVDKIISNQISLSDSYQISANFFVTLTNSISLQSAIETLTEIAYGVLITNSISVLGDMSRETLIDQKGYQRDFGNGPNAENKPLSSYTYISDPTTTYVKISATNTTWTEVV